MALNPRLAREHYARQRRIAERATLAVSRLFRRNAPLPQIVATAAAYQLASATASTQSIAAAAGSPRPLTSAAPFAGVSSAGFPLAEPLIATIDAYVPAPAEALPANWWADALDFMASVEQLIESEVQDAGRAAAQVEIAARPDWQNYVRVLNPPSCKRCVVLAGRIYRDLEGFQRHPRCDCVNWPVQDWEEAHDAGLVSSPREAFDKGAIRDLTAAETQAITDGADIAAVVNSSRGIYTADIYGRRVKATREGTTRRGAWRKANPSRPVRLRPDAIYAIADGDRTEALRLLRLYGYIK